MAHRQAPMTTARITEPDGPTAYTAMAVRITPTEELERAGFRSPSTIYTVFQSGKPVSDYDPHRLARRLSGEAGWVVDALHELKDELPEVAATDGGADGLEQRVAELERKMEHVTAHNRRDTAPEGRR